MENPNRSIRAPSTIIKSSKPRTYNGPLAQSRFKLLNSVGPITNPPDKTNNQLANNLQPTIVTASSTSRIPSKPSGLAKPTPVKHIISAASTTSAIKQPTQRPLTSSRPSSSGGSKLTELRLQSATKSVSPKKPTALYQFNNHQLSQQQQSQQTKQATQIESVSSSASNSNLLDVSILNSVTGDVGAIRRLLEQLLGLLQSSSQETKDIQESYATLERENEQLRRENTELKNKLRAIKSTVKHNRESAIPEESESHRGNDDRRPTSSDLFYTPMH